jgi:hypothetical protein
MMVTSVVTSHQEEAITSPERREEALRLESFRPRSAGEKYIVSELPEAMPQVLRPVLDIEPLPSDSIDGRFVFFGETQRFRTAYNLVPMLDGITCASEQPGVITYSPRARDGRYLPRRPPKVLPEAKRLLTQDVRELLDRLIALIIAKAQLSFIPIIAFTVRIRGYPQEKYEELIIQVSVQASAKQALAFWDALGATVATWETMVVPAELRERLVSLISVSVVWS